MFQIRRDVFVDWRFGSGPIVLQWRLRSWRILGWRWIFFHGFEAVLGPGEIGIVGRFGPLLFGFCDADGRNGGDHEVVADFGLGRNDSCVELLAAFEFKPFGVCCLCQADSVTFSADEICNLLVLKSNHREWLGPLLIIADA